MVNANLQKGMIARAVLACFGHFAEKLIMEDGTCTGVYVRNADTGLYKKVNAAKGVILSCGDCGSNPDMMACFFPPSLRTATATLAEYGRRGKSHQHGRCLQDGFLGGRCFLAVPGADGARDGRSGRYGCPGCLDGLDRAASAPQLPASASRTKTWPPPNANSRSTCSPNASVPRLRFPPRRAASLFINTFASPLEEFDARVGDGTIFKGETLEELFASIEGMDAEEVKSVERYNELCAAGYDEDFGKKEKYLLPVQDGPFTLNAWAWACACARWADFPPTKTPT